MKIAVFVKRRRVVWQKYIAVSEIPGAFLIGVDKEPAWECLL